MNDSDLDRELAALPKMDVSDFSRARIRQRALDALAQNQTSGAMRSLERAYAWIMEPVLVFGVGTTYLVWAFVTVLGIYR